MQRFPSTGGLSVPCYVFFKQKTAYGMIGEKGSLSFSVFTYQPIEVITSEGKNSITVPNPPYVQLPLIKSVIQHLQGIGKCDCTSVSATAVNWVLDRVLWKN